VADVFNRNVVRVRENISLKSSPPQFFVQFNHLWNRDKNVRKIADEFVKAAGEAGDLPHIGKELFPRQQAGFKSCENGRTAEEMLQIRKLFCAARGDFFRGD